MRSEVDVIVVGGGHNGLVAAAYVARAGLRVLVLEQDERLGGMAMSAPLVASAPGHVLSPGAYENVYFRASGIGEELDLAAHGYREVDSAGWAWLGESGESLRFERDAEATARSIARFSAADARAYRELVRVALAFLPVQERYFAGPAGRPGWGTLGAAVRGLGRDRAARSVLGGVLAGTAADAIPALFESEALRGAFASIATILAAPTTEGSAAALFATTLLHHRGAARPIGGMGGLVAALERCVRAHGGEVRTGARVARVLEAGGRARGVALAGGEEVIARRGVVLAVPPQRAPGLAELPRTQAARLRAAPANAAGVATLTVSLALSGTVRAERHDDLRAPVLFTGTLESVLDACAAAAQGRLPVAFPWWATIFTALDPSQAPPGQDSVQLFGPAPVHPQDGWPALRDHAADALVAQAGTVLPGLEPLELGRHVETPEDLSARTGASNGCIYHVDHLPTRMGPLRPALGAASHRLGVGGLYLTGAGTHPSGGVSGLPGRHAATALLADA